MTKIWNFDLEKCAYKAQKKPVAIVGAVILVQKRANHLIPGVIKKEVIYIPKMVPAITPKDTFTSNDL